MKKTKEKIPKIRGKVKNKKECKKNGKGVKFNIQSVSAQLILAFMVPIVFIIFLGMITYTKASKTVINNYKTSANQTLSANSNYVNLILDNVEAKSIQIATNANIAKYYGGGYKKNSNDEFNAFNAAYQDLVATIGSDKFIYTISILSNQNNPISTFHNFDTDVYKEFPDSEEAKKLEKGGGKFMWTGYHQFLDKTLKVPEDKYGISLTRYLYNKSSKPIGYVILDIKTESIQRVLDGIDFGANCYTAFVAPDERILWKDFGDLKTKKKVLSLDFYKKALNSKEISGTSSVLFNHEKYLFMYNKIGNTGSMLFSMIPEENIIKQVDNIKEITIGIVIIAVFIAFVTGTVISSGMSHTIKKIVRDVDKVAKGDLTVALRIGQKNEFGLLSSSISDMVTSMRNLIQKTVLVTETVNSSAITVNDIGTGLIGMTENMSESFDEIEKGAVQQGQDAQSCLAQMDHLSGKITVVHDNTMKIETIAQETRETVNQGMSTVNTLEERVTNTSAIMRTIIEEVECLKSETSSIEGIIDIIKDLANQTNLLSLNASIEAARAGQAGKGFSVVAEEIRKLAEQSMEASEKVRSGIEMIHTRANGMVKTGQTADVIVSSQETALLETVDAFTSINKHVDKLVGHLDEILGGIYEVENLKGDTLNAIESISAIIEESVAVTDEVGETATNQLQLARELNEAIAGLKNDSDTLEEAVKIFKL